MEDASDAYDMLEECARKTEQEQQVQPVQPSSDTGADRVDSQVRSSLAALDFTLWSGQFLCVNRQDVNR